MSGFDARLRLFDRYSEQLSRIAPNALDVYRCPICMKDFGRDAASSGLLTLEDVIPKQLGATILVLTCKRCNNEVGGSAIDSQLHHDLEFELFVRGEGNPIKAELYIHDQRLAVRYGRVIQEGSVANELHVVARATAPEAIKKSQPAFQALEAGSELTIKMPIPSKRRARIALLKCGYLMAFQQLGYAYILNKSLDIVRDQIRSPHEHLIPIDATIFSIPESAPSNRPLLVKSPDCLRGILVPLELRHRGAIWRKGILLPGPDSAIDLYAQSERARQSGQELQFVLAPVAPD